MIARLKVLAILDRFEPGAIGWAVLGLVGALSVIALGLAVFNGAKKAFGRQPTFDQVIKTLLSFDDFKAYKEEQRLRCVGLETQISAARHSFDERANKDLVESANQFKTIFRLIGERDKLHSEMAHVMSRLQERTETHLRKFDQYDTKLDNLLREVSAAAARGVQQAQAKQ